MGVPRLLEKPVVVAEVEGRRRRLLRSELELHHVRRPRLEPHATEVLIAAAKNHNTLHLHLDLDLDLHYMT